MKLFLMDIEFHSKLLHYTFKSISFLILLLHSSTVIILPHELVPTWVHYILIQSLVTSILDFFFFNYALSLFIIRGDWNLYFLRAITDVALEHFVNCEICCCGWNFLIPFITFVQSRVGSHFLAAWSPTQLPLQLSNQTDTTQYWLAFLYFDIARHFSVVNEKAVLLVFNNAVSAVNISVFI